MEKRGRDLVRSGRATVEEKEKPELGEKEAGQPKTRRKT